VPPSEKQAIVSGTASIVAKASPDDTALSALEPDCLLGKQFSGLVTASVYIILHNPKHPPAEATILFNTSGWNIVPSSAMSIRFAEWSGIFDDMLTTRLG